MELTGDSAELVECGSNCAVVVLELGTIHGGQQQMLGLGKDRLARRPAPPRPSRLRAYGAAAKSDEERGAGLTGVGSLCPRPHVTEQRLGLRYLATLLQRRTKCC